MNSKNKNVEDSFDKFIASSDLKEILSAFNQLCDLLDLNPSENSSSFYSNLQYKLKGYWKAQTLFTKLDKKVTQKEYRRQTACPTIKALIIGSGPCGLRSAIELALLGARVIVIEKRESFSRNNVLHLWPFVINDLKVLGAKIFFGMFCAGSIDHISIRRLQCILFKIALLFGVQFFCGVTFESLILPTKNSNCNISGKGDFEYFPNENCGWRAKVLPEDHIISNYEFNTIIGADGKTNVLGFPRKELRCRLAIAITANFINKNTSEEAQVEEISGVAFIFNQQFFKDMCNKTGIDLENIVYYKDETHYFVMTAKKHSLLSKGVIMQDYDDPDLLLNPNNINYEALQNYAKEAANVATNNKLSNLEFSKNHRGEPDVAVFDFTHMFVAENASKISEHNGILLLQMLVGDSLLEPFWPTGSGCALGFLSCLDAAWLVRRLGMINNALDDNKISNYEQRILILEAIAERECIYQRLSQTTSSNMPPNFNLYTLNPRTRYAQCKTNSFEIKQILHLYDTNDKSKKISALKNDHASKSEMKNKPNQFNSLCSPKLMGLNISNNSYKDSVITKSDTTMKGEYMLRWFQIRLDRYFNYKLFRVDDLSKSWFSGVAFLCLIHLYSPDSIDLSSINDENRLKNLETAFKLFDNEFHIVNTFNLSNCLDNLDSMSIFMYLEKIYETLRILNPNRSSEEIYKHRSVDIRKIKRRSLPKNNINKFDSKFYVDTTSRIMRKSREDRFGCGDIEKGIIEMRKEEILRLYTTNFKETVPIVKKIVNGPVNPIEQVLKNLPINRQKDLKNKSCDKYSAKIFEKYKLVGLLCHFCKTRLFQNKFDTFENYVFHKYCFRCQYCNKDLNNQQFKLLKLHNESEGKFYCLRHFEKLSNISFIREKNVSNTLRNLEDKKLQKLTIKDIREKYSSEERIKIKKPKYCLKDFGCPLPENISNTIPANQIFENICCLSENNVEIYLRKNLLCLKRVNNESDEEYDGSQEEVSNRLLSLDVVEPFEENQFSWSLSYNKLDLDYALKKCQVIRKNRLIYKKYKSKDESTSDESEVNMLVHDICRTSDDDILEDNLVFDKQEEIEIIRSTDISQSDIYLHNQTTDNNVINEESNILCVSEKDIIDDINIDNEVPQQFLENTVIEVPIKIDVDANISEINKIDNSRNLRQMAKLKFCTEPPKPVSINPKEFISQINHNKLAVFNVPCCIESAEYLPSVNEIFLRITNQCPPSHTKLIVHEKCLLSASILSINNYGLNRQITAFVSNEENNSSNNYITLIPTDCFDSPSIDIARKHCIIPPNIFNDMYDIKDIDSLSVNTEDSSITHTELNSENEIFKINGSVKFRPTQKATLDSEIDISLGMSSIGEIPFENKFCSNNSLDSIESSSLNSSANSGISASSESDSKMSFCPKNSNDMKYVADIAYHKTDDKVPLFSNSFIKRFKSNKISKYSKLHRNNPSKTSSITVNIEKKFKEIPSVQTPLICNTVTPPHDIELDNKDIKCLEFNSDISFAIEDSIPIIDLDNISTNYHRMNHIHKQLENIEDRLNDLEIKEIDFKDISNNINVTDNLIIRDMSTTDKIFHENANNITNDNLEI